MKIIITRDKQINHNFLQLVFFSLFTIYVTKQLNTFKYYKLENNVTVFVSNTKVLFLSELQKPPALILNYNKTAEYVFQNG